MRGPAANTHGDALRAFGAAGELALGGLSVDEEATRCGETIRGTRAIGPFLLANDKEEVHALFTVLRQAIGRAEHGGGNALGVRGSAPRQAITLKSRWKIWRDGVEVGREGDAAPPTCGPHVGAPASDLLQADVPTAGDQPTRNEVDRATLGAGRRIDCQ